MADRISLPTTPPGLHDQMMRGDGYGPRPVSPPPPRSANTLVVGGPAYFTPEGYQAPPQPTQSFMPTNVTPDPIRDQFNRMYPTPPPPPAQTTPAPAPTPAPPVQEPAPTQTGGVGDPAPYVPDLTRIEGGPPVYATDAELHATPNEYLYRPPPPQEDESNFLAFQQTPQYQDWVNSGGIGTMDMYTASDGREFGSGTVGRMYDEYLASLGQQDSNTSAPTPAPEPVFTPPPTMPEPNGFFPGINLEDFEDLDFSGLPKFNLPKFAASSGLYEIPAAPGPIFQQPAGNAMHEFNQRGLDRAIAEMGAVKKMGAVKNQQKSIREALATPAPIYTPPPKMEEMFEDYDYGNPNLRDRGMFGPGR